MAADVSLGVGITTTGEDALRQLQSEVLALAKSGGEAAPIYERLAGELDKLAKEAGAVQSVKQFGVEVQAAADALFEASVRASDVRGRFEQAAASTLELTEAQRKAKQEFRDAEDALRGARLGLSTLKAETDDASKKTSAYEVGLRAARKEIIANQEALALKKRALQDANEELKQAEAAEKKLAAQLERSEKSTRSMAASLAESNTTLTAATVAANALGVEVDDLARAEERLASVQQALVQGALTEVAQQERAAAEAAQLAAAEQRALAQATEVLKSELEQLAQAERDAKKAAEERAAQLREAQEWADRQIAAEREAAAAARAAAEAMTQAEVAQRKLTEQGDRIKVWAQGFERAEQAARDAAAAARAVEEADKRVAESARLAAEARDKEVKAIDAMVAKAAEMQRAAEYTRWWAQELDRLDTEAKKARDQMESLAASQKKAADALKEAFGQTGVRSLQAIGAEATQVRDSVALLKREFDAGGISANDFARAVSSAETRLAALQREARTLPAIPGMFERINSVINDTISRFGSLTAAIATVGYAAKPILDANLQLETLRKVLTNVTGSAEGAAKMIEFLNTTAKENNLSVGALSGNFQSFVASMLKAGQSVETTQSVFRGVALASDRLGLSSERAGNVLLALGQIANKGKLALEELQGQIGESLPGALKVAADSMGITTAELTKLIEGGKILAEDFLPAFGRGMEAEFGKGARTAVTLSQAFENVKTAATLAAQRIADTSAYKLLTSAVDGLGKNFDTFLGLLGSAGKAYAAIKIIDWARDFVGLKNAIEVTTAAKARDVVATEAQVVAGKQQEAATAAVMAATVRDTEATLANATAKRAAATASTFSSGAMTALATTLEKGAVGAGAMVSRVGSLVTALGGPYGVALTAAIAFSDQLGNALARMAAKATGAEAELKKNEAAVKAAAEAEASAARRTEEANKRREESIAKVQVVYQKDIEAAKTRVQVSENLLEAAKKEGQAAQELARLTGDQQKALNAAADAAGRNEVAARQLADALGKEVGVREAAMAAEIRAAGGIEKLTAARQESVRKQQEEIDKLKARREALAAQADADGAAADRAFLSARANQDLSQSLEKLQKNLEDAKIKTALLIEQQKVGAATSAQVAQAQRDEAVAYGLVAAAIQQKIQRTRLEADSAAAASAMRRAEIDLRMEESRVIGRQAELRGNERAAIEQQVVQTRLQADATREQARAALERAQAEKQAAQIELANRTDLTELQKLELRNRIANAEAAIMEAKARQASTMSVYAEVQALEQRAQTVAGGGGGTIGTGWRYSRPGSDAPGPNNGGVAGMDTNGNVVYADPSKAASLTPVDASGVFALLGKQQSGTLSTQDKQAVINALNSMRANQQAEQTAASRGGMAGATSAEGRRDTEEWIRKLEEMLQAILRMEEQSGKNTGSQSTSGASGGKTYNIVINGVPRTVSTADAGSAAALEQLLSQLGDAQSRSGGG